MTYVFHLWGTPGQSRSKQERRDDRLEISGGFLWLWSSLSLEILHGNPLRWSKDVRSRENAARSRSKVSSNQLPLRAPPANQLPSQVAATQLPPMVVANQLPPRVVANQPISQASVNLPDPILDESVQEFSSSPRTEEPRKPKRRIAYGWLVLTLGYLIVDGINAQVPICIHTKGSPRVKKNVFFRALPGKGGGRPLPEFFDPVFPPCCPLYFDINIMLCDTFWSFLTPKSSKVPKLLSQLSLTSLL